MKKWLAGVTALVLLISCAAVAAMAANNPVKLIVNGREIKADVPPQLVNGRTMVSVRWVAEALGAEVRREGGAVYIDSPALASAKLVTPQQVARWIKEQGKSDPDSYYLDGLTYELANIDADEALELVAKIDGGVHLGQFFIFDRNGKGTYQLITEQNWKVDSWDFTHPIELAGENKGIFKLVTRDGGTGIDQFTARLCYLEQDQFIEAWRGILLERSTMARDAYYQKTGSYQVDDQSKRLYAWETAHRLDRDGVTPLGELQTVTGVYVFNGTVFAEPAQENNLGAVELSYTPEPVTVLEPGAPEQGWEKLKSVEVKDVGGREKIRVHLYMQPGERRESQGEVRAFLEDRGVQYQLGVAGSYGLDGVGAQAKDMNRDGTRELVISGGMGADYGEMKMIGYDPARKGWVKLLAMGTPLDVDLDGDGQPELVAGSGGSLPGYVWLYRWNKDHFEKADVARDTGNIYAYVMQKDGQVWIEAGQWVPDQPGVPHYYQYQAGKLLEIPRPPAT